MKDRPTTPSVLPRWWPILLGIVLILLGVWVWQYLADRSAVAGALIPARFQLVYPVAKVVTA